MQPERTAVSLAGQGTERFHDACRKFNQALQRWEDFLAGQRPVGGEGQRKLRGGGGVSHDGQVGRTVVIPTTENRTSHGHRSGNEGRMFVPNIEIVDSAKSDVPTRIWLEPAQE